MIQSSMEEFRYTVTDELEGERIDKCISILIDTISRSYVQKLIKDEQVFVNGKVIKSNYILKEEDEIFFLLPAAVEPDILPQDIPLDILYEDKDVIIINKPKDMVVHPSAGHYSNTLVNALLFHCANDLSGINGVMRPGIVHRIDRNTTGSLIVCKNDYSHSFISSQLKDHSITRKYHAIVHGTFKEQEGTITGTIGRHPNDRKKMAIHVKNGKEATTHYRVIEQFHNYAYIECTLETGRTHQIRVHMTSINHPLLGDDVYGNIKSPFHLEGQTLHAKTLGFIHPTSKEYIEVDAPLPDYFLKLLKILREK